MKKKRQEFVTYKNLLSFKAICLSQPATTDLPMLKKIIPKTMTRKDILITWVFGSLLLMLITSVISMLVWNFNVQADPQIPGNPIDHLSSMAFQVPVGWFLSFLSPFGWVNILFLLLSTYLRLPVLLTGSAIATVLSGIWWPMLHITMMGL